MKKSVLAFLIIILFLGCQDVKIQAPKPRQFPKIDFPQTSFTENFFSQCPFAMAVPSYFVYEKKEYIYEEKAGSPCWFNLRFDSWSIKIYFSYYPIDANHELNALIDDAYTMVSKHNVRASFRKEESFQTPFGSNGILFKLQGPVATPYQFYITDNTNHFLRGSLYYQRIPDQDSIQAFNQFIEKDLDKMLNSLRWNKG